MTMMLHFVTFLVALTIVAVDISLADDGDHVCLADGSHCSCRDEHESCGYWLSLGEW